MIVSMSAALRPTAALQNILDRMPVVRLDKPAIGSGVMELRVKKAPATLGLPDETYVWGVVELYESGHQEVLIGGVKPSAVEASVEGSTALDALLKGQ